jgi:hypothetical protein
MATFAELAAYERETIPDEPQPAHPKAGRPCVERLDGRHYRVNFAVQTGPRPNVHAMQTEAQLLKELVQELRRLLDPDGCNVDPPDVLVTAPTLPAVSRILGACEKAGIATHCPVRLRDRRLDAPDPRNEPLFQPGKVTVSTIKSAKGHTAHVCHVAFVHELAAEGATKEAAQQARAQLHVACTRETLYLDLWGLPCPLMAEAQRAHDALT